jgi:hypothetical protein
MRRVIVGIFLALVFSRAASAETRAPSFTETLSPEARQQLGLDHLTPEQLAQLDRAVDTYKRDALQDAQRKASEAIAAREAAEKQAADAAAKAKSLADESTKQRAQIDKLSRWKRLFGGGNESSKAPPEIIESKIAGKFRGWDKGWIITLENGQKWQVVNADHYFTPPMDGPKVEISRASFATFWLTVPELNISVRVRLISE